MFRFRTLSSAGRGQSPDAKPLAGFFGAGVLEVVEDFDGDTFRAINTVRFADSIYLPHVFQKKSKKGISTHKKDIELIKARLKIAEVLNRKK